MRLKIKLVVLFVLAFSVLGLGPSRNDRSKVYACSFAKCKALPGGGWACVPGPGLTMCTATYEYCDDPICALEGD